MLTISDLYSQDLEEPIFVLYLPTSHKENFNDERYFVNRNKFIIDDQPRTPTYERCQLGIPFRLLSVLGPNSRVHLVEKPSSLLVDHWNKKLAQDINFRYTDLNQKAPYVTLFPFECLPEASHAVNPHCHYRVYSKNFIQTIDCPQPAVYTDLKLPAILKTYRGCGNASVWKIFSKDDYDKWTSYVNENMPDTDVVLTELVQHIKYDYSVEVYIDKTGKYTWMGTSENKFSADGYWCGVVYDLRDQAMIQKTLEYAIKPVIKALHKANYFGWCSIDVLEDHVGKHYVIDLNTRLSGSTPLMLGLRALEPRGWTCGLYKEPISLNKSLAEVISETECISGGEVIVHAGYEKDGKTCCHMGFYSTGKQQCARLLDMVVHGKNSE